MIEAISVTKRFDQIIAVNEITSQIRPGAVFGLVGSNGAGKSTFLRLLAGVLKPDEGSLTIDGQPIFENTGIKRRCFYISDEQYFFPNTTPDALRSFYASIYPNFDNARFFHLMEGFSLDPKRKISTFSKGMKKQVSVICAISAGVEYIFADETFDGLDPVARQAVKGLLAADIAERGITPVIASHNLRELEDICDHVGLLHRGGILFSRDLEDMMQDAHKVQAAFSAPVTREDFPELDILRFEARGSLVTMTLRGRAEQIEAAMQARTPLFWELLPLSLEEIFIDETEVVGYDIKRLLF
ncbi:MAG: ABC transporter ATP-binding protein [Clostridiales bacterium]|nr:ABC transporter ATP-binding protein [Clostridiales bacterium]